MIHVLTGNGAGKTTSSIGHIIRAIGQEGKGLIVQFYKNDQNAGDFRFFFEKHPGANVDIIQYGVKCQVPEKREQNLCFTCGLCMSDKSLLRRRVRKAIKRVKEGIYEYDSIILDEILVAYSFGHISAEEIMDICDMADGKEIYLTGRLFGHENIPAWLEDMADYLTIMLEVKHPFKDMGKDARVGVEI